MTSSESLREVRAEGRRATGPDGARRPRADRIELDFTWSDQSTSRSSSRPTARRSGRLEERAEPGIAPVPAGRRVSEPLPAPTVEDVVAHTLTITPSPTPNGASAHVLGAPPETATTRRTVVIRGQATRGYVRSRRGYEARLRPHERSGFKPDRVALWAVLLGIALLLGAVTSSHAAGLSAGALHHLLLHRALLHPAP